MPGMLRLATVGAALALGAAQASAAPPSSSPNAPAQVPTARIGSDYTYGPVTDVSYIRVEYGRFETYIDWLNSTWKPTMVALKKAGIIIDYKVYQLRPKSPDEPNLILMLTFKNMAAYAGDMGDKVEEFEAVTDKVICNTECQNNARVARGEYRKLLGNELIREVILK
ncbi:MAG TPA: hypothetical protein VNH64_08615 [Parvularculaceae bacterium]|nr:hypothetical protein [Parvularculaceae bacterium]